MKYLSLFLIINILAISVILSSADDPSADNVKEIHSRATITIKDRSPSESDDSSVPAKLEFIKDGKIVNEIEEGSVINFKIRVASSSASFKNGRVKQCIMYEKDNRANSKELLHECNESEFMNNLHWLQEEQSFKSELKVVKLPGSTSNEVEIECEAIVCEESCPDPECLSRQKRGLFFKKPSSFWLRARKVG